MVNNRYMGTPQIPVLVDGKTYYGCCKMCEARLKQEARLWSSVDPVSRRTVDKATAVIARDLAGDVLYFESEESLRSYNAGR
jgi:YHS domain-containing protein